ncbi:Cell wall ECM33 [Lecanosticta acicola]|uniref:Cell wall ECM33 n=1 Tax=Lecanosticta acicola TaxID=111012 RepID=A0AAI8Z613_9PEZI|nr:Cell wall ECM33 [Lecanosticta acicola]
MAVLRYIAPALAVAAGAAAQSCGNGGTTTIQSNADATGLASCRTYSGSIAIATGTTDNIQLSNIQTITGSLTASNVTQMTSLAADSLQEIGDSFTLTSLTILSTLNFPQLTKVDTIEWTALPALQGLSFSTGVQDVSMLTIDNTQLNNLNGINLEVVDTMYVANNPYLTSVNMQLGNVTKALTLAANGRDLDVQFPNLMWAYNMSIRNASSVSIPSLASVNGSLGFYSDGFENLTAPNLTSVGGQLSFVSCNAVTNISMPELTTIGGGFQLANNTQLGQIDGFPALKTVGGALDFNGVFTDVSLPKLSDVRGAFNLQSTKNIDSACTHFSSLSGSNNAIKGVFTCKGSLTNPGGTGTLPSGTNSGGSSTSSGAATPVLIPGVTGFLGVVAAIFGLL